MEDLVVNAIKQEIKRLPQDDQKCIASLAEKFRGMLRHYGKNARIALALVGAEEASDAREIHD